MKSTCLSVDHLVTDILISCHFMTMFQNSKDFDVASLVGFGVYPGIIPTVVELLRGKKRF